MDVIGPAIERAKRQLFKPFRISQWLRFAFVGLLAGEVGGSGGCSLRYPFNLPNRSGQQFQLPNVLAQRGLALVIGLALLITLGIILGIALVYVSSRMRFVLFDSIVEGQCQIRNYWSRRGEPAFRYFVWQILFTLVAIAGFVGIIGIPFLAAASLGWFSNPRQHILEFVVGGIVVGLLFFSLIVAFAVVHVLTKDFVVPQMALDNVTAAEGWRRLWPMMKEEKGGYAAYIGMKIVLSIAATVIFGIITLLVLLVVLLPAGGAGAVIFVIARNAGLTWNLLTIALTAIAAVILAGLLLFIIGMISVPSTVFFPAYSLYFFAERYPALRTRWYPVPPTPDR